MRRASSLVWINIQFSSEFPMPYVGHASYMVPSLYTDSMRFPLPFIFIALYLLYIVGIVMTVIFMPPLAVCCPPLSCCSLSLSQQVPLLLPCPLTLLCNDPACFSRIAYKEWMKGGLQETMHLISGSTTEVTDQPLMEYKPPGRGRALWATPVDYVF